MRQRNDPENNNLNDNRGHSLIEVMISIAIFSIGFLAIGSMQIASINANAKSRMRTEATAIATAKVEQFMARDYAVIGSAGSETRGPFTISWTFAENTEETLKTAMVTVSWVTKNRTKSVNLNFKTANM